MPFDRQAMNYTLEQAFKGRKSELIAKGMPEDEAAKMAAYDIGFRVPTDSNATPENRLRNALHAIKALCAGDARPNWDNSFETTTTRGRIMDIVDAALGNIK